MVSLFMYFDTMRMFKIVIFRFFFRKSKKFRNLFCLQRAPFTFFDILQQTGFPKNPKGPAFTENLLCRKFISLTLWVDAE